MKLCFWVNTASVGLVAIAAAMALSIATARAEAWQTLDDWAYVRAKTCEASWLAQVRQMELQIADLTKERDALKAAAAPAAPK